jgi:hypothetical protein
MKISTIYLKAFFLALPFLSMGCQKVSTNHLLLSESNRAIAMNNDAKSGQGYVIISDIGHEAKNCPGCILINGELVHIDCQGTGNACRVSSNVSLYSSGNSAYIVTTDTFGLTDHDFFNMPSRSLFVEYDEKNNEVWLNIPAQLVFRDSTTRQFTFTGLYYSNSAVFEND